MIGMSSSSRSFESLGSYLVAGRSGQERDRVAWSASRNLPTHDPELGAKIMRATAAQNVRVEKPVYHLALSFDPTDPVDRAVMERVADRVITALGLEEHQVLIVAHKDRDHPHMHLLVNRVHPETGRVWSRWQDQRIVQQVLREEEHALGLRQVPGRLSRDPGRLMESTAVSRMHERNPQSVMDGPETQSRGPFASVEELVSSLQVYERVADLTQQQFAAKIDAEAARARATQLASMFDRARVTHEEFVSALGRVYSAPDGATEAFGRIAAEHGVEAAIYTLRHAPERLGPLAAVERQGLLGFGREADTGPARAAAAQAAEMGEEAIVAARALSASTSFVRARRADDVFLRSLRSLYQDPAKANAAFRSLATEHGLEHAEMVLRERPAELGEIRSSLRDDLSRVSDLARVAGALGATAGRLDASSGITPIGLWDEKVRSELTRERGANEGHATESAELDRTLRRELAAVPGMTELRNQISHAAGRLLPRELQRLRSMVSAPQMALVMTLRASVRDILLARESERSV